MNTVSRPALTLKQKLFLSLGVPLFFLTSLELLCRIAKLPSLFQGAAPGLKLEMPTWMLKDPNAVARQSAVVKSEKTVDWLSLFVEGDGYRVHMIPNTERRVSNTFSLIKADRDKKYLVRSNSLGFRGDEIQEQKEPNSFRILIFGDSSSFGWGVDQNDSYASRLKEQLQNKFPDRKIEIGNFAIPGDSSAYGRLLFDKFAERFNPDMVIFGFGANDAKEVLTSHSAQVESFRKNSELLKVASLLDASALFRTIRTLLSKAATKSAPAAPKARVVAVSGADYSANLSYMIEETHKFNQAQPFVLTLCTPGNYVKRAKIAARQDSAMFLNGQGLLLKNLKRIQSGQIYPEVLQTMEQEYGDDLRTNKLYYITSDGCHPNALGHRIVADRLTDMITPAVRKKLG